MLVYGKLFAAALQSVVTSLLRVPGCAIAMAAGLTDLPRGVTAGGVIQKPCGRTLREGRR